MPDWLHRLIRHHWPLWEACDYDFLTWRYRCVRCRGSDDAD